MRSVGAGRDRMIRGTLLAALAFVAPAVFGAPAASAACPNEAFRVGPSALLPECRAYEMVTPVDKESGVAVDGYQGTSVVSPSGDGIFYYSPSAYAGQQGNVQKNSYVGARGGEGWDVDGVGGPQSSAFFTTKSTLGIRDDLALSVIASQEALAPGAIQFGSNAYLRDNRTGTYTTLAAVPGVEAFAEWTETTPLFIDAANDWSDILLSSRHALTPDATAGLPHLYEYREGALHLAVDGGEPTRTSQAIPNMMSADGSRFYYKQEEKIYLHLRGQETPILVSENEEGNPVGQPEFVGATPDGQVAFFFARLGALYRFEASAPPGDRITDLTPVEAGRSAGVGNAYVGEVGTTVYFVTRELLTPDAQPRPEGTGTDFYAWHGERGTDGALRYLGKTERMSEEPGGPTIASVSPNGRFFGFESLGEVTPDAVQDPAGSCPAPDIFSPRQPCQNVFLYSLDSNQIVCASCTGSPHTSDSRIGGGFLTSTLGPQSPPVLDDGSVLFETALALVPRDVNGAVDVYRRRGETTELVSTGTDPAPSTYVGASADGSNLFFQTAQPLVGQDNDTIADLYDSRVGGGLPQSGQTPAPSCIVGGGCRVGAVPASPAQAPGSRSFDGAGNVRGACGALAGKARAARKRSRAIARRARHAHGGNAQSLRKKAARQAKAAHRLGRRAGSCTGGAR